MAYLLLTDHLPYGHVTEGELMKGSVFERPVTLPSRMNIDVDHHLERIVLKALAPSPSDRYADAAEMLADLDDWATAARPSGKTLASPVTSKQRISPDASSLDESGAAAMVDRALELARQASTLAEAADLMEEAFNKAPGLRDRHAGRVRLWRNGIVQ
jgi:serine/threonine-protein kinase